MSENESQPAAQSPSQPGASAADEALIETLSAEISKAMIGQSRVVQECLIALVAGGHVLLEGVPGLGKTLLVRAISAAVGGDFGRVQFTPDLMPADVTGHALFDPKSEKFVIRRGPVFCNFLLADEINRAPAKTQAALLEVMQELQVTIEGKSHVLAQPFMTFATQNPLEMEGTYPLPEAQLDRFLFKVQIDYPDQAEECALVRQVTDGQVGNVLGVEQLQPVMSGEQLLSLQQQAARLKIDEQVFSYAVELVRVTRQAPAISVGAGPRGSIAIIRAARAAALLAGRDFVTPSDVKKVAAPALRHRIILTPELEMEGRTADSVLAELIERVPAPRT